MLEIAIASPVDAQDAALVQEIAALVNSVYAAGEKGIWADGTARTAPDQIAAMMRAGELAIARRDNLLLGVVRLQVLPTGEGEFGMLAAHPAHQGAGLGRALVAYAENWSRAQGLTVMQLELLYPTEWEHPVKSFLRAWYTRSGYRLVGTGVFADDYPALARRLATACDYLIFQKDLQEPPN